MHHLKASLVSIGLLAALVGSTVGLDGPGQDVARLEQPPTLRTIKETVNAVTRKEWVFGGTLMACLDRPGRVEVTEVVPDGDLTVTGFATRPNPGARGGDLAGTVPFTLEEEGIPATSGPLTLVCDGTGRNLHEVIVEVRAGERTTSAKGFLVRYVSGGHELERYYEWEIVLCVDSSRGECPRLDEAV